MLELVWTDGTTYTTTIIICHIDILRDKWTGEKNPNIYKSIWVWYVKSDFM